MHNAVSPIPKPICQRLQLENMIEKVANDFFEHAENKFTHLKLTK